MKGRTKAALLVGGLAVAAVVALATLPGAVLAMTLARGLSGYHMCETGFSRLSSCTMQWSSTTTGRTGADNTFHSDSVDVTAWGVAQCPQNALARRLLCAVPAAAAPVEAGLDDVATGLPVPEPWLVRTAHTSSLITSVHVETPLALAAALGFYRGTLSGRGWAENDGAVVASDRAVIAFATSDGPALLRLTQQDDRTIVDLSLRKSAAANAGLLPPPGQAKLMLGNATDDAAAITINAQTVTLAARAGAKLAHTADEAAKLPDSQKIDLPPGQYEVTVDSASGATQTRAFEVAAGETWGLLVGPDGVPLPVHLY